MMQGPPVSGGLRTVHGRSRSNPETGAVLASLHNRDGRSHSGAQSPEGDPVNFREYARRVLDTFLESSLRSSSDGEAGSPVYPRPRPAHQEVNTLEMIKEFDEEKRRSKAFSVLSNDDETPVTPDFIARPKAFSVLSSDSGTIILGADDLRPKAFSAVSSDSGTLYSGADSHRPKTLSILSGGSAASFPDSTTRSIDCFPTIDGVPLDSTDESTPMSYKYVAMMGAHTVKPAGLDGAADSGRVTNGNGSSPSLSLSPGSRRRHASYKHAVKWHRRGSDADDLTEPNVLSEEACSGEDADGAIHFHTHFSDTSMAADMSLEAGVDMMPDLAHNKPDVEDGVADDEIKIRYHDDDYDDDDDEKTISTSSQAPFSGVKSHVEVVGRMQSSGNWSPDIIITKSSDGERPGFERTTSSSLSSEEERTLVEEEKLKGEHGEGEKAVWVTHHEDGMTEVTTKCDYVEELSPDTSHSSLFDEDDRKHDLPEKKKKSVFRRAKERLIALRFKKEKNDLYRSDSRSENELQIHSVTPRPPMKKKKKKRPSFFKRASSHTLPTAARYAELERLHVTKHGHVSNTTSRTLDGNASPGKSDTVALEKPKKGVSRAATLSGGERGTVVGTNLYIEQEEETRDTYKNGKLLKRTTMKSDNRHSDAVVKEGVARGSAVLSDVKEKRLPEEQTGWDRILHSIRVRFEKKPKDKKKGDSQELLRSDSEHSNDSTWKRRWNQLKPKRNSLRQKSGGGSGDLLGFSLPMEAQSGGRHGHHHRGGNTSSAASSGDSTAAPPATHSLPMHFKEDKAYGSGDRSVSMLKVNSKSNGKKSKNVSDPVPMFPTQAKAEMGRTNSAVADLSSEAIGSTSANRLDYNAKNKHSLLKSNAEKSRLVGDGLSVKNKRPPAGSQRSESMKGSSLPRSGGGRKETRGIAAFSSVGEFRTRDAHEGVEDGRRVVKTREVSSEYLKNGRLPPRSPQSPRSPRDSTDAVDGSYFSSQSKGKGNRSSVEQKALALQHVPGFDPSGGFSVDYDVELDRSVMRDKEHNRVLLVTHKETHGYVRGEESTTASESECSSSAQRSSSGSGSGRKASARRVAQRLTDIAESFAITSLGTAGGEQLPSPAESSGSGGLVGGVGRRGSLSPSHSRTRLGDGGSLAARSSKSPSPRLSSPAEDGPSDSQGAVGGATAAGNCNDLDAANEIVRIVKGHVDHLQFDGEVLRCLLSDVTLSHFSSIADQSIPSGESAVNQVARLFKLSSFFVGVAGIGGAIASKIKEYTLDYLEHKFAQDVTNSGGWDSMLEESDYDLD